VCPAGQFDKETIGKMKHGAFLINNARGAIADRAAVVEACESGQLAAYAGDVWDEQPASKDHPWRNMPNNTMTAHTSGTTLDAQVWWGTLHVRATQSNLDSVLQGVETVPV
jgi:formate dehydrogenase